MAARQPSLSVIVVTWNARAEAARNLPSLAAQLLPGDELLVVDNASTDGTPELLAERLPEARIVRNPENLGFAAGCNRGAEAAGGDLLLFLNPDARPAPGFAEAIRRPLAEGWGWAGWMGLVTSEEGRTVNTDGNPVHFTGISWAGRAGEPIALADSSPREVAGLSGVCLAVPRESFLGWGGLPAQYFMYQEDLDISLRLRLEGGRIGLVPDAVVDHDYTFSKGAGKWRRLERNRLAVLIRTYPAPLLALLAPALLLTELGLVPIAIAGGWLRQKLLANWDAIRWLPRLLGERRRIQARRTISSVEFARWLTPELSSRYLGRAARFPPLRWGLRAYWRVVMALLAPLRASRSS